MLKAHINSSKNKWCLKREREKKAPGLLDQSPSPSFEHRKETSPASKQGGGNNQRERRGCNKVGSGWEFLRQRAPLTASLKDHSNIPKGSRWDSVVSSVASGEGRAGLMHNGGSADHRVPHRCGNSSITVCVCAARLLKYPLYNTKHFI